MSTPHTRPGFPGRGEANHLWRGREVSYYGALKRLREARGKASEHACHECGAVAYRWVLVGEATHHDADHGWAYSLDHDDYVPLCGRCHRIGKNAP